LVANTKVLLASGAAIPISQLKPGMKVLATNTKTGKTQPETISAVMIHHDTNLYDLKIRTDVGTSVIHTTSNHLFWDPYLDQWIPANHLKVGEKLQTPNGALAAADGGATPADHDGWMWDLTVPGNGDHDFYVLPAPSSSHHAYHVLARNTPVLVHNGGPSCGELWMDPNKLPHHYMRTSDEGVMHAEDFGVSGPYNKANGGAFVNAISRFVKSPDTQVLDGTFRGERAIHYVNPDTGLHASFAARGSNVGEYLGGWKSSGDQLRYLLEQGKL
jgi:hypothetical protein